MINYIVTVNELLAIFPEICANSHDFTTDSCLFHKCEPKNTII